MTKLALDIGGANLKWALSACPEAVTRHRHCTGSEPFALAREPDALAFHLRKRITSAAPDRVLVTMTAELCDCFATRAEGVRCVLDAVAAAAGRREVAVWSTQGHFIAPDQARAQPMDVAAGNWHALASMVAAHHADDCSAVLFDVGSTTSDIIPLCHGRVAAQGRTDTHRLAHGELVYVGVKHTPLCALGAHVLLHGQRIAVMAEWFATLADAHLLMGAMPEAPTDCDTPDGRPRTVRAAAARVLRMIGSDLDHHTLDEARTLAAAFAGAAVDRLVDAAAQVTAAQGEPGSVIVSGSGEWLAAQVAARVWPGAPVRALSASLGNAASAAACAHALLMLDETLKASDGASP